MRSKGPYPIMRKLIKLESERGKVDAVSQELLAK